MESNARLIASAPELLEALESMCHLVTHHTEFETLEKRRAVLAAARVAISKAKGV